MTLSSGSPQRVVIAMVRTEIPGRALLGWNDRLILAFT